MATISLTALTADIAALQTAVGNAVSDLEALKAEVTSLQAGTITQAQIDALAATVTTATTNLTNAVTANPP